MMFLFGFQGIGQIPLALMAEILLLNGTLSLFAAYHFHKAGFLAPVGVHFWTDGVWHVFWGIV